MPRAGLHLLTACAVVMTMSGACMEHSLKPVEIGKDPYPGPGPCLVQANKNVDILFVIDNSGSMGEEQAILANNFASFIEVLEADHVRANYRIGVTTTDNSNPWCPHALTTPEAGNLVLSSCKDRLGDFTFAGVDASDVACNDICDLGAAALEIQPTTTTYDLDPAPRPWLESIDGKTNLPTTTSMADAFRCVGPQGINGCGFESQLESMYLALLRTQSIGEPSFGFLRPDALLAIVFVTDEADCSYNKSFSEIFAQDGKRSFWSDPEFPTSAVCWNAGVSCSGDPSNYSSCDAVNKDVNGTEGVADADAVLHPLSRYVGYLQGLEQQKRQLRPDHDIIIGLIGGVDSEGELHYHDVSAKDPSFQKSFGIGPGCEAMNSSEPDAPVRAVPPVRLRELVDAFTPGNMFSICEQDYSDALDTIAEAIGDQILPSCYFSCVEDTDPSTRIVDPKCVLEERSPGSDATTIHECRRDSEGYVVQAGVYAMPAADVNVCHVMLTDDPTQMLTATTADDMSAHCADANLNLEFEIERRPGFPGTPGAAISATCSLADFPDLSCPGIGG